MQTYASRIGKLAALGATAVFGASAASADISDVVFRVTATNEAGTAVWEANTLETNDYGFGYWNTENTIYTWQMTSDIVLSNGATILAQAGGTSSGVVIHNDPQVNMGFAVQAGASTTLFEIDSALLSFPSIPGAIGKANAVYTVTDITPGGVTLTGAGPDGGAYLAQYNGYVPTGTDFTEQIPLVFAASGSNNSSFNDPALGYRAVGATVSDMSSKAKFTLSRFDLASGTTNYEIIPEPTTALMLLPLAAVAMRRRS